MRGYEMLIAVGYADSDLIQKAETVAESAGRRRFKGKSVLIAAMAALLLCGTAAAAGILWNKPDVRVNEDGQTLMFDQGYTVLADDTVSAILEACDPERSNVASLHFETVAEWQAFFRLPFVSSPLLLPEASSGQAEDSEGGSSGGALFTIVSVEEANGMPRPASMNAILSVEYTCTDDDGSERRWIGDLQVFAAFTEEASSGSARFIHQGISEMSTVEYTTPSGIPCVISQYGVDGRVAAAYLYYAYESVLYRLDVHAGSADADELLEDLKQIADTLQIVNPAE